MKGITDLVRNYKLQQGIVVTLVSTMQRERRCEHGSIWQQLKMAKCSVETPAH